jgi:hypothetical protein
MWRAVAEMAVVALAAVRPAVEIAREREYPGSTERRGTMQFEAAENFASSECLSYRLWTTPAKLWFHLPYAIRAKHPAARAVHRISLNRPTELVLRESIQCV